MYAAAFFDFAHDVLSDLGLPAPSEQVLSEWLVFGEQYAIVALTVYIELRGEVTS